MGGSLPRVRAAAQLSRVGLSEAAFPADSGQGTVKTSFVAILAKTVKLACNSGLPVCKKPLIPASSSIINKSGW